MVSITLPRPARNLRKSLDIDDEKDFLGRKLFKLYPPTVPYSSGFLDVDSGHTLYWEQCGNPDGIPAFVFHGGPGEGSSPIHRRLYDPEHYRIILFDQRGAGRSSPLGCVQNNTLEHLISDVERLRQHLRVERMHIMGGSWGSTLSLAYAVRYPERCISLTLRGIFLLQQKEIDWFLYGLRRIYPEAWEKFSNFIPKDERDNLLRAYHSRLFGDDLELAQQAGKSWYEYETSCAYFLPRTGTLFTRDQYTVAHAMAKLESHYFMNEVIDPETSFLKDIKKIRSIPSTIIQGRYDVLCPIETAYDLHTRWPEADYVVVPDGGHSLRNPSIRSRLIEATEHGKRLV